MAKKRAARAEDIEEIVEDLAVAFGRLSEALSDLARKVADDGPSETKTRSRRDLKLQGRYMAAIRSLPPADKEKIRRLRARRGIEAAIEAALELAPKSKKPPRRR